MYIRLPPGINFGISLKRSEITQMGCFWSPLYSYSQDLTQNLVRNITHHASHITHHILHRNLTVLQNFNDQHCGDLQQFIKNDPEDFWQIFFDGNNHIDNTNSYGRSKISQTKHFTMKQGTFWKVLFSLKILKNWNTCFFL